MEDNVYTRAIRSRFQGFQSALDKTLELIADTGNHASRAAQAEVLFLAGRDLLEMLAESDRPQWLKLLTNEARKLSNREQNNSLSFLKTAVRLYPSVAPIEVSGSQSCDFDALFESMRVSGRMPELFDRMIEAVSQMIETGDIENIYVIRALSKLLDLLKANREGSYLAVVTTFNYARFIKNYLGELLKRVPGVSEFAVAYERTVEEGEQEMAKLQTDLQSEAIKLLLDEKSRGKLESMTVARIGDSAPIAGPEDTIDGEFKRIE